jgi:hypothetical protein
MARVERGKRALLSLSSALQSTVQKHASYSLLLLRLLCVFIAVAVHQQNDSAGHS